MTDAHLPSAVSRTTPRGGWPLVASVATIAIGLAIGPKFVATAPDPTLLAVLGLVGILMVMAGLVASARTPDAPATQPFLALAAATAALTALQTIDQVLTPTTPVGLFLLTGPWRYMLTPVVVHFALSMAWFDQARSWLGVVTGWYALHVAMFIATTGGLISGEAPLVRVVDGFFLRQTFEPMGATIAAGALLLSIASPHRRASQRRAVLSALAAVLLGLAPAVLFSLVPSLPATIGIPAEAPFITLPLLAAFGVIGVLALPMVNPQKRDLIAYPLAQRLLDEMDLAAGLRGLAETLRDTFEAEAVVIRLGTPSVEVTVGTPRRTRPEGPFVPEAETFEERRAVVAPIGRSGDPLGEVYLEGRFPGAFGRRERDWLMAFLGPISSVIRVRRREAERSAQFAQFASDAGDVSRGLAHATGLLPDLARDDGRGVPLPVDASEVLAQLGEGSRTIGSGSEGLERVAAEARAHTRAATDAIARAMDGVTSLSSELLRVERHAEAIAAGNDTVDGVAFRTNLLANTAALEASRAGVAGRTFAVLAEEIRRLADATGEASTTIAGETAALSAERARLHEQLEQVRSGLAESIREAEASEESVRQIAVLAGALESSARALWPAVEEANAVSQRRSARDSHLTTTFDALVTERTTLVNALSAHRDAVDRLGEQLERLARAGRGRPRTAGR